MPHVEITREIARKFNNQYGKVFPEPEPKLTKFARLPGLDGNAKMSKSLGNTILLSDDPETIKSKMKKAVTDPNKVRKGDPGNPEICLVFSYHKKFNPEEVLEVDAGCRSGALGCFDCKMNCSSKISELVEPIREKRKYFESNINEVKDILLDGEKRGREEAVKTMNEVHSKMELG